MGAGVPAESIDPGESPNRRFDITHVEDQGMFLGRGVAVRETLCGNRWGPGSGWCRAATRAAVPTRRRRRRGCRPRNHIIGGSSETTTIAAFARATHTRTRCTSAGSSGASSSRSPATGVGDAGRGLARAGVAHGGCPAWSSSYPLLFASAEVVGRPAGSGSEPAGRGMRRCGGRRARPARVGPDGWRVGQVK